MDSGCERAVLLARYIVETGDTVRGAAHAFGVSKSTVHSDVSKRLRRLNPALWRECAKVLAHNKEERHLRGGDATRAKYARQKADALCGNGGAAGGCAGI